VQRDLPKEAADFELISTDELIAIRALWRSERHDWEDSVPRIYESVFNKRWFQASDVRQDNADDAALTDEIAEKHSIPPLLLRKLIDAERKSQGLRRRSSIYKDLNSVFDRDWRDDRTISSDLAALGK